MRDVDHRESQKKVFKKLFHSVHNFNYPDRLLLRLPVTCISTTSCHLPLLYHTPLAAPTTQPHPHFSIANFNMRTTKIILGLMALFATTAIAGSNKKPQRTCDDCTTKAAHMRGRTYHIASLNLPLTHAKIFAELPQVVRGSYRVRCLRSACVHLRGR